MTVQEALEKLLDIAKENDELRTKLLATKGEKNPVSAFCKLANEAGVELSAMELILAGEESYAAMRRSTNGGGENAPLLKGEDDLYEMFLIELQ